MLESYGWSGSFASISYVWFAAMRAAILAGMVTLLMVCSMRAIFRHRLSNSISHLLYLLVPLKTVTAVLWFACPLPVTLPLPRPLAQATHEVRSFIAFDSPSRIESNLRLEPGTRGGPHLASFAISDTEKQRSLSDSRPSSGSPTTAIRSPIHDRAVVVRSESTSTSIRTRSVAMLAWACVSVLAMTVCLVRHGIFMRWVRRDSTEVSVESSQLVEELAQRMGLRRTPEIRETAAVTSPAVIGPLRPCVVVPTGFFQAFDHDVCRWAIAHELAHIRRLDLWSLAFERITGIAFCICPALWCSQRASRHFRELACDDAAQEASGLSGGDCAESFLNLIVWSGRKGATARSMTPALSLTHRYPAIRRRILNMTDTNRFRRSARLSRTAAALCGFAMIMTALPLVPRITADDPQSSGPGPQAKNSPASDATPAETAKTAAANSPISIGGTVVDENDMPVPNAEIIIMSWKKFYVDGQPDRVTRTKSDGAGKFRLEVVTDVERIPLIQVTHPDFAHDSFAFRPNDSLYRPLIEGNAIIRMHKGVTVHGKVVGPDGEPVAGVKVQSVRPSFLDEARDATTDAAGEFTCVHAAPRGLDAFVARKPGFGLSVAQIPNSGKFPDPLIIRLDDARSFRAKVTDPRGEPLAGVVVEMRLFASSNFTLHQVVTGDDGRIAFDDLPAGQDLTMHLHKPGFIYELRKIPASDREEKTIEMRKSVSITGNVTDRRDDRPIDRFEMRMEGMDETDSTWKGRTSSEKYGGRYRFESVSFLPKTFRFVFEADGYRPHTTGQYTLESSPSRLDVKLEPIPDEDRPRYRGKVVGIDGKPVANVRIGLFTDRDFPEFENGRITRTHREGLIPLTDADGHFDFRSATPVREVLILHESGVLRQKITPESDSSNLEWKLRPYGRIAGSLKRNGKPDLDSKIVMIYRSGVPNYFGPRLLIPLKDDGSFVVENVIPGDVSLDFRLDGVSINDHTNMWKSYLVEPGQTTTIDRDLHVTGGPRRNVKGRIRFTDRKMTLNMSQSRFILRAPDGNPLRVTAESPWENAPERLKYRETPEGKAMHQALEEFALLEKSVTPEGEFEIKGMPEGTFELSIWPGNLNTSYGTARKVIRVEPSKPGEPNTTIDVGEIDVISPNAGIRMLENRRIEPEKPAISKPAAGTKSN